MNDLIGEAMSQSNYASLKRNIEQTTINGSRSTRVHTRSHARL